MKPTLPFAQYDADIDHLHILHKAIPDGVTNLYTEDFVRQQQEKLTKYELRHVEQRKRIEELENQIKDLTDEEILEIAISCHGDVQGLIDFARAILRKAQEK